MTTTKPPTRKPAKRIMDVQAHHRQWLERAEEVAYLPVSRGGSPHPSVKVGAVLVDGKNLEIASSSNRFATGVDRRRPERYKDGSKSLWINCAEQLAIAQALKKRADLKDARLYVTLEPCAVCAGMVGELGIKQVFIPVGSLRRYAKLKAKWKSSIEIGLIKLAESGAQITAIDTKTKN
jgi:deoxycytidylate deaminase